MPILSSIYDALHSPVGVALLATAVLLGLWNMYRQPAGNTSQNIMRWRVGLQFALVCLLIGIALMRR